LENWIFGFGSSAALRVTKLGFGPSASLSVTKLEFDIDF
jgi:hypothetical protein